MASLKDIRSRIQSTKNTQQITRAMKMVSAAKLRRAQMNVVNARPYARKLRTMIRRISASQRISHPLLSFSDSIQKVLVVMVTSDRGLCGAFNNNVNRATFDFYTKNRGSLQQLDFLCVGRKGADFLKKRGIQPKEVFTGLDKRISHAEAGNLAEQLVTVYSQGEYDEVRFIYNEFKSALQQDIVNERLLPVQLEVAAEPTQEGSHDILFEPAPEQIIDQLLHKHFAVQVYRCLCESLASEHGARMTSMENATKNAQEMIRQYTLTYNKLRQASITTELIEITSGAEALKG